MEESQTNSIIELESAIEAILYAAGHSVTYAKLSEVLGVQVRELRQLISHMSEKYNSAKSKRGIALIMYDDGCQFCTKEAFAPYIREALGIRRGGNLSASSMEVLAIVAYNQPVTRSYVDTVRGVDSAYAMNSLIDKELIEAVGRLDAPGRPMLYGTTHNFLRVFGINSISELPSVEPITVDGEASGQVAVSEQLTLDIESAAPDTEETAEE